ncbi:MAG TPA: type VI secretion system tip protein VgrG, partial [Candidatus Nanopelagicales bacterium]|nr:type VI secretion system tip protein VgrG [Candidatus Nanopelagicales bacterium]
RSDARGTPYRVELTLVPHDGQRAFRPPPKEPEETPRIEGIEPALVTGPAGEEIHVDDLGSVKVRFFWDREGPRDDRSSLWVRTLQLDMQGALFLPRMGWEVPVMFIAGNPDMPFVLGRAYNAKTSVPYGLPAQKATSTMLSATSPGDGTAHEIRLDDGAGAMQVQITATKDQSVRVGGSAKTKVGVDEVHAIDRSHRVHVVGSQTITISGSQTNAVGGFASIKVGGTRTEIIGAMESVGVTQNRTVESSGLYTEVIGGVYGLQCNQSNVTVNGAAVQVAGALGVVAGLGLNETVMGLRMQRVGGARVIVAKVSAEDSTIGPKKINSGAMKGEAATDVGTLCKGVGKLDVSGSLDIQAGGVAAFIAPSMIIGVGGSLLAVGGSKLKAGGSATFMGGVLVIDAPTTEKKATSEVKPG